MKRETAWDQGPQGALFVETEIRGIIQKLGEYWGQIDRKCLGNGRDTGIEPTTYSAVGGQCYHWAMCSLVYPDSKVQNKVVEHFHSYFSSEFIGK